MNENKELIPKLRELRRSTGATLEQAAERVDVHPATLSRWERGESHGAETEALRQLVAWYVLRAERGVRTARAVCVGDRGD